MILFIDDEKKYVRNYIEELESFGYEVKYIKYVNEAFDFIQSEEAENLEAIVLDAMMPSDEGYADKESDVGMEFYKRFRKYFPETKVFVLTNVSREEVREFFENQENCDFYRKDDIMPVEFSIKVNTVLKK